jgi:hypothetical protein
MKWLHILAVVFLAAVCIRGDETIEVSSSDELEISFYGLDDSEGGETAVEAEEQEAEPTPEFTTAIPTGGPWTGRPGRRGHGHHRRHHGRHHGGQTWGGRGNSSPEAKLNYICNSLQSESSSDRMARKFQRKFSRLSEEQRASIQQIMSGRKAAISACCQMTGDERQQCAEEVRNARYERVCNGEEALCIWTELKGDSRQSAAMSAIVQRCCASAGQERQTCFTEARSQYFRGSHRRHYSRGDNQP